jgi:hypothetical protein
MRCANDKQKVGLADVSYPTDGDLHSGYKQSACSHGAIMSARRRYIDLIPDLAPAQLQGRFFNFSASATTAREAMPAPSSNRA